MKLPTRTIRDGAEAERAEFPPGADRLKHARVRKSDVQVVGYVKPPCDLCHGENHPPLQVLKYNPRRRQWLCQSCREPNHD